MYQKLSWWRLFGFVVIFAMTQPCYGQLKKESERVLLEAYQREKNDVKKFVNLLNLAEYYKVNNIHKADSIKSIVLEKSRVFNDSLRFAALFYNAEIDLMNGNREAYFNSVLGSQAFLTKVGSNEVQYEIYKHLGNYHSLIGEFETADFYLKSSLKIAKRTKSKEDIASACIYLSKNFMLSNQKDSAIRMVDLAIQNARRTSNKGILAESFNCQSEMYSFFDQMELSVAKNMIALQLAMEINDYQKIAKYSREIGQAQRTINNLDDAEYYFKQSMEYSTKIRDDRQRALALSDLGTISFQKKQFSVAIRRNEEAIVILDKIHDAKGLGNAHNNLGIIYREQKNFTKAATNFNQALIYFESIGNKERIATVFHNVGTVFLAQKKHSNALNYLEKSIEIRKQSGSQNQIYHTYRIISDVYKDLGQTGKSLNYLTMYMDYVDSNASLQSATKIAELSELYRAEQKDRLITSQADSIEKQRQDKAIASTKLENIQLKNRFQTYIIAGFLVIIVLAGVIIFFRWNQTKLLQQQRETEMSQTLLRAQMNPHFVFNAMSVIQSYIYENDTENSSKFLVNFSRLMRLILENSSKEEIPIETEEDILRKYLETQKLRFEDRFEYSIEIEEVIEFEGAMIPPMITQPFIENSIEHGQLHTIDGGFIHVKFSKNEGMLEITIEDNGVGRKGAELNKKSKEHKSMAMQITSDRIKNLNKKYRTEGSVIVEDYNKKLQTGTKVLISLPYRTDSQLNN